MGEVKLRGPLLWGFVLPAILICAAAVAFTPALDGEFLNWDDDRNIVSNAEFRGPGLSWLRWAWRTYHLGVWQPVSWMILSAQWQIGGLTPRTFHLTSIGLHVMNCLLLYYLMVRLLGFRQARNEMDRRETHDSSVRLGAAAATLLFAIHPLRVEPVVWISSQPYLPAVLFYLLSVLTYLRSVDTPATARRLVWLGVSLACFTLALGSKAAAVSLPIVLIILDIGILRRWKGAGAVGPVRCLLEKLPFVLVALPICLWAIAAKDYNESRAPWADFDLSARFAQAAAGIVFYLHKTILPVDLSPYYRMPPDIRLGAWPYIAFAVAVVCLTVLLIAMRRRWPAALAAWLAYIVILLPNLGIVQISQQIAADRYGYLALMPIFVWVAAWIGGLWRRARLFGAAACGVVVVALIGCVTAFTFSTRAYAAHWTNSPALWQRVLDLDPDCAVAHCNRGEALLREGRYAEASPHLSRAIDLEPDFSFAYVNFAALLLHAERFEDAAGAGEHAIRCQPPLTGLDLARAHAICGEAYAALRRDDLAWEHTLRARELGFVEAEKMLDYLRDVRSRRSLSGSEQP